MIKFDAKSISNELIRRAKQGVNNAIPVLMEELKAITPELTKEMVQSYKVEKTTTIGGTVEAWITNTAKHALLVEYGVWQTFDYHKPAGPEPRPIIYRGKGNKTFARGTDNARKIVLEKIYEWLNQ